MAKIVPCILVVEDDRAVRDLLVAFLKKGGHTRVVTAGNAEEALFYLLRDPGLDVRLAIVDLVLPNASGLALIRKLRNAKSAHRRATPVLVLTGRTDTNTYKMAARRGIQGYLMKPVSASLFLQAVTDLLAGRKPGLAGDAPAIQANQALNDVPLPPSLDD
ncbi:MAG: response regulator [Rhodospirillaceae bacterium]